MMFWYGGAGWAWWQAGLMWLVMIAFWALLIWVVYTLVTSIIRRGGEQERGGRQPDGARRILDERLARGEIDADEYRRLRDILDGGTGRSPSGTGSGRLPPRRLGGSAAGAPGRRRGVVSTATG